MNYKASDVDGSWATNALHESLKEFNAQSSKHAEQMLNLTKAIVALTVVMLIGLAVQISLAIWPITPSAPAAVSGAAVAPAPPIPSTSAIATTPSAEPKSQSRALPGG